MTTIRSLILVPIGVCLWLSMVAADEPHRIGSCLHLMVVWRLVYQIIGHRLHFEYVQSAELGDLLERQRGVVDKPRRRSMGHQWKGGLVAQGEPLRTAETIRAAPCGAAVVPAM